MNRVIQIFLFCIAVLVIGALAYQSYMVQQSSEPKTEAPVFTRTEVNSNTLPEKFPADFPLEKNAQVLSNYTATGQGIFQSTRQFQSKKTIDENFKIYNDYLTQNKWVVESILNNSKIPDTKSISAVKGPAHVTITLNRNNYTKLVTVDIVFIYR